MAGNHTDCGRAFDRDRGWRGIDRPGRWHSGLADRRDRVGRGIADMMMPAHKVRILVATQPVDFRTGHDGLAALKRFAFNLVLPRLRSGLSTHLCGLSFECQGAFAIQ